MRTNIQHIIEQYLTTDDSFTLRNQKNIVKMYSNLSPKEKHTIDSLFIELCGYSMETIIKELDTLSHKV